MERVSIIIPNYNNARYLRECLDTVTSQDYPDTEIVVVDDGSSDDSVEIIAGYRIAHKNLKLYQTDNVGPNKARQLGIKQATGKYVMFVDSDDCIDKSAVKIMVNKIKQTGVGVVKAGVIQYPSGGLTAPILKNGEKERCLDHAEIIELLATGYALNSLWGKLYKKALLDRTQAFDTDVCMGEDLLVNVDVLGNLDKMLAINDVLYYYRNKSTDSLTRTNDPKRIVKNIKDRIFVSNKMLDFIMKNVDDANVRDRAFYEQLKPIWMTIKKLVKINGYDKNDFCNDFGAVFESMNLQDIDIDRVKKYIRRLSLLERMKNGYAVRHLAGLNYTMLWKCFAGYRVLKKVTTGVAKC